jgi:DNA-directed RNA polymerase subunit RPC12/RpoP
MVTLQSTITCPDCGHRSREIMPTDACQYSYVCKRCGLQIRPKKGDCCVYCSYGDVPCPPIQDERMQRSADKGCCSHSES